MLASTPLPTDTIEPPTRTQLPTKPQVDLRIEQDTHKHTFTPIPSDFYSRKYVPINSTWSLRSACVGICSSTSYHVNPKADVCTCVAEYRSCSMHIMMYVMSLSHTNTHKHTHTHTQKQWKHRCISIHIHRYIRTAFSGRKSFASKVKRFRKNTLLTKQQKQHNDSPRESF